MLEKSTNPAITHNEFNIIAALKNQPGLSQRTLAEKTNLSLGSVNTALKNASAKKLISQNKITQKGIDTLEPYRVKNAVIMAAGLSSRFSPISYELPKGLITVRGEVLIERQIRQLQSAGINDISIIVGYKQEKFFYLEDEFNVKIIPNKEYRERNNNSSIMTVANILSNTYICSSDNYFDENPFETYVWKAYYSAQYQQGNTKEWCMSVGPHDRITSVKIGGSNAWYMIGHAYFDTEFSTKFLNILRAEYNLPQTAGKLWENIFIEHLDELNMQMRRYDPPIIHEFDSLDELREFDPLFLENVDSKVFDRIVAVLGCKKSDIRNVYPLKNGLTNLSCHFSVGEKEYVYRHPGVGTNVLINRKAENEALLVAQKLGLDGTLVACDPENGWKISHYLKDCRIADFHKQNDLHEGMRIIRKLHESGKKVNRKFDFYEESKRYMRDLEARNIVLPEGADDLLNKVNCLHKIVSEECEQAQSSNEAGNAGSTENAGNAGSTENAENANCLCHNDLLGANVLVDSNSNYHLIDWEYAGMSDYAQDLGTMCVSDAMSEQEFNAALAEYFERKPTKSEHRHCAAYVGFAGWCWYLWALLKEAEGDPVSDCRYLYYRYAKQYTERALSEYRKA